MRPKAELLQAVAKTRVVPVVRMHAQVDMTDTLRALLAGGIRIIEITATTPGYLETIRALSEAFRNEPDVYVGAGTILDVEAMRRAREAGADFIVSPVFLPELVQACVAEGIAIMPGCMTPTEIYGAWKMGADVIKAFPGGICTPAFFRDIRGPFPDLRMMPTGNVNETTAPEYIRAGAIAVGIGKALVDEQRILADDYAAITQNAKKFTALLQGVE